MVFHSSASNLVSGDIAGTWDVFLHDRQSGETIRLGPSNLSHPSISSDGNFVAFMSNSNILPEDTNGGTDIYVYDRVEDKLILASVTLGGLASVASGYPSLSGNGRYVAFQSTASNLVTGDTNLTEDVFIRDLESNTTIRASVSSGDVQGNNPSRRPALNFDGTWIAFHSGATNLVSETITGFQVIERNLETKENRLASVSDNDDVANGTSQDPAISADGRFVTFMSYGNNLVPNDTNGTFDIFIHDFDSGRTTRADISNTGAQGNGSNPSISADGSLVVFESTASTLIPGTFGGALAATNIFVPAPDPVDAAPLRNYYIALPITLSWTGVSWAVQYEIQVADNTSFSGASDFIVPNSALQKVISSLENGSYYWRVRAQNSASTWGAWSTTDRFTLNVP